MQWSGEHPARRAREQDRALRRFLRHELAVGSAFYHERLPVAGVDPARPLGGGPGAGRAGLAGVPPTSWDEVAADPAAFLLRPTEATIARHGERRVVLAITWAKLLRRTDRVNRHLIDPLYKPVHWHLVDGVPIGYTARDLDLLAEAGARVLSLAGLNRYDTLVGLTEPGPHLPYWQLVLGAREAGVSALHLGPTADAALIEEAGPDVLAGPAPVLADTLRRLNRAGLALPELHTLIVMGEDPDLATREALRVAAEDVGASAPAVVAAWAPRGVRALWAECREGPGFHTYPDFELLEVEGEDGRPQREGHGQLLWSSLRWRGTAFLRLATGATGEVRDLTCPACGRRGPMVVSRARSVLTGPLRVLEARQDVAAYQVELRRVDGTEELLVFMALEPGADLVAVLRDLDRHLHATQYVVTDASQVRRKVERAGSRVVDLR